MSKRRKVWWNWKKVICQKSQKLVRTSKEGHPFNLLCNCQLAFVWGVHQARDELCLWYLKNYLFEISLQFSPGLMQMFFSDVLNKKSMYMYYSLNPCPNMIHFGAIDFSEFCNLWSSDKFLLTLRVSIQKVIKTHKHIQWKLNIKRMRSDITNCFLWSQWNKLLCFVLFRDYWYDKQNFMVPKDLVILSFPCIQRRVPG